MLQKSIILKKLNLFNNKLICLPQEIGHLDNLEILLLSYNKLNLQTPYTVPTSGVYWVSMAISANFSNVNKAIHTPDNAFWNYPQVTGSSIAAGIPAGTIPTVTLRSFTYPYTNTNTETPANLNAPLSLTYSSYSFCFFVNN